MDDPDVRSRMPRSVGYGHMNGNSSRGSDK